MTKVWVHSKCASLRKEGRKFNKKATKNYVWAGFAAKKRDATHSKKHQILRVTFFLILTYFGVFFMSVFVDDINDFL